jgi:hypothetical protein
VFYAYIDESYTDERYYIASAVADRASWDCVSEKLEGIRQRTHEEHGTPLDIEFHADELMNGRKNWKPLRGKHREAGGIYSAVLDAAASCGIKFVLRGLDIPRLHARYRYPDQPHKIVLGHTLERLHERSRDYHSSEMITVIADEIATQKQHLDQFEGYQVWGTPGYRSSTLSTIVPPITFAPSYSDDGLQVADFGAYLHRRRSTHVEVHPQAQRAMQRLGAKLDEMTVHNMTWEP